MLKNQPPDRVLEHYLKKTDLFQPVCPTWALRIARTPKKSTGIFPKIFEGYTSSVGNLLAQWAANNHSPVANSQYK